jgi:hypothetical protein
VNWTDVRTAYPDEWLVVEAIRFHDEADTFVGDAVTVVEKCPDGAVAFDTWRRLHRQYPQREFVFVHTSREDLRTEERRWIGIRAVH